MNILNYIFNLIKKNNFISYLKYLFFFSFLSIYSFANSITFFVLTSIFLKSKIHWLENIFQLSKYNAVDLTCFVLLINSILYELIFYIINKRYLLFKESLRGIIALKFFEKILQQELTVYLNKNFNDYVRVCYNSSQDIVYILELFKESIVAILTISLSLIALYTANKYLTILLILIFVIILMLKYRNKKRRELVLLGFNHENYTKNYINYIEDIFNIYKEIKVFRRQADVIAISEERMNKIGEAKFILDKHHILSTSYLQSLFLIIILTFILIFSYVQINIIQFIPILLLALISIQKVIPGVNILYLLLSHLSVSKYLLTEGKQLFQENNIKTLAPIPIKLFHEIIIQGAGITYGSKKIINNFSCIIYSSSITAVIGESGKGKTTFVEILAGLKDFKTGTISIDGQKVESFSQINSIISFVPQKVHLINDTLRNNITLFNDQFTDQEIWEVLNAVNMKTIIELFPNQLNTIIQKGGSNLSVGQAHRIGIARAMLYKAKLIILDEFSAALDNENKLQIFEILQNIKKHMAIVITTHDSDIIDLVDHKIIL